MTEAIEAAREPEALKIQRQFDATPDQILAINFAAVEASHLAVVGELDLPGAEVERGTAAEALPNRTLYGQVVGAVLRH